MNITKESLEQEIMIYQQKLAKYERDPEYVDPNCSIKQIKEILKRLEREYHFNYKKD